MSKAHLLVSWMNIVIGGLGCDAALTAAATYFPFPISRIKNTVFIVNLHYEFLKPYKYSDNSANEDNSFRNHIR